LVEPTALEAEPLFSLIFVFTEPPKDSANVEYTNLTSLRLRARSKV